MIPSQPAAIPLTMALLAAAGVSQQKPVKEVPLVINYAVKPITLERATARAHAVVRARVVGSQFRDLREPGVPVPNMNTVYALNVVEVLKRDPNLPVPTQVVRSGGDLETDEGIRRYVEDGFPAFQPGEEYLLFLYWNKNLATYQMSFGVDGAYRITPENRLHALGRGVLAQRYTGQDAREVADRIREIAAELRAVTPRSRLELLKHLSDALPVGLRQARHLARRLAPRLDRHLIPEQA